MPDRNYSLTTLATDGPLTAPRWVHYVIRILLGLLLALPFMMRLGWTPEFAWIPGTVVVVLARRAGIVWKWFIPVGFRRWPFPFGFDDAMLDFSLHVMLMPLAQFIARPTFYEGALASFVTIVLIAGFLDRYPDPSQ